MEPFNMNHLKAFWLGFGLILYAATPLFAADTEVFFGTGNNGSNAQPNMLFILDNSGSMGWEARDATGAPTGQSRMDAMKEAFDAIISSATGINIGLMRFNWPGGSVLYPMRDIDSQLPLEPRNTVPEMLSSSDDAT